MILKGLKGGHYLKEILILNSFSFEDKDPRFTRLKPDLALRLLSKGLLYIRAMVTIKIQDFWADFATDLKRGHVSCFSCHSHSHGAFAMFIL